ncbi:MAG: hypothetical protein ACRDY2_12995 [Acidimicrobiales bacterium]
MRFAPWTSDGHLRDGVTVARHERGSCFTGSIAVDSPDAWRCLIGNYLYDPCFASPSPASTTLACVASPWSLVTLLKLDHALPLTYANKAGGPSYPWAFTLANGQRCVVGTGANGTVAGVTLDYYCGSGAAGRLDTSAKRWTVDYVPTGAASSTTVAVTQAMES